MMRVGGFGVVKTSCRCSARHHRTSARYTDQTRHHSNGSKSHDSNYHGHPVSRKQHQKLLDRDFFLSVFSASATKRDAKAYLSRYKTQENARDFNNTLEPPSKNEYERKERLQRSGVNLGGLYGQARAIQDSPVFTQRKLPDRYTLDSARPTHVAVVKLRDVDELDEQTRTGVALTLSQLARLGLLSCVVAEPSDKIKEIDWAEWRKNIIKHCFKLANAINAQSKSGARVLDQALGLSTYGEDTPSTAPVHGRISVAMHENLLATLQRGFIPIIPPIAYTGDLAARPIRADEAMLALTREFAGLTRSDDELQSDANWQTSVDKIIVLDPVGGLPAADKADQSHIFVNLEQEYSSVRDELSELAQDLTRRLLSGKTVTTHGGEAEKANKIRKLEQHAKNLDLIKNCLALLPPSSSALLTTPSEAASSALFNRTKSAMGSSGPSVGTRAKRNPLIHNLLTDKPTISSSLPSNRLAITPRQGISATDMTTPTPATFFKRGMSLTIIPDPRSAPWVAPSPGETSALRLEKDPRIDFPRLLHLIEDSFGRPLDVSHYLSRISGRIAGVIVAGEYEGGAILTWEDPAPSTPGSRPLVPYLDKFAVLRRSQGSGGVADIVFNAMVRTCLPDGVVWRSRKTNPVNKWYFERSIGTCKLANSQWCMFWTGDGVNFGHKDGMEMGQKRERWNDYVSVCSNIEASWADRHDKPPD